MPETIQNFNFRIKFLLEKPGRSTIIFSGTDIQATSLTVKWTAPADDGGSFITAYRVIILKGGTEVKNVNITDPGITSLSVGDLERDTEYNVKVFARNAVFEGAAAQKTIRTKTNGEILLFLGHRSLIRNKKQTAVLNILKLNGF